MTRLLNDLRWTYWQWTDHRFERVMHAVVWHLPRRLVYWAFVRVATEGCRGHPGEQSVVEAMRRWEERP